MLAAPDLTQEVLHVLPQDPQAQLELANRIINHAYQQKVHQFDEEKQRLSDALTTKNNTIKSLERRVGHLESEVAELQAKNKVAVENAFQLQHEKGALIDTVKKLNREIAKLESFKKSLIQHLQDEDDEPTQMARSLAAVDLNTERLVADVLSSATKSTAQTATGGLGLGAFSTGTLKTAPTPSVPPTVNSRHVGNGSDRVGYNTNTTNNSTSSPQYRSQSPPSAYAPHTQHSKAHTAQQPGSYGSMDVGSGGGMGGGGHNSPPQALDGREFFKQARGRLSYEQFSLFLNAIKDLNAQRQTREETLRFVRDLCGSAHADLYNSFEALLSRHMPGF